MAENTNFMEEGKQEGSSGLEGIISTFEEMIEASKDHSYAPWEDFDYFDLCSLLFSEKNYNANDVEEFVNNHFLDYCKRENLIESPVPGVFISTMLNYLEEESELNLKPRMKLSNMGYELKKNHRINYEGDVGKATAKNMRKGSLYIKGNADEVDGLHPESNAKVTLEGNAGDVGAMLAGGEIEIKGDAITAGYRQISGKIIIHGDAGRVGEKKSGGTIYVKGNVGDSLGDKMTGGENIVDGKAYGRLGYNKTGGSIYVGGLEKA